MKRSLAFGRAAVLTLPLGVALLLLGEHAFPAQPAMSTSIAAIRSGDLLLFDGSSPRSALLRLLRLGGARFSHVGLASVEEDSIWVLHSDPRRGCVKERLLGLLESARVRSVTAFRPSVPPSVSQTALEAARQFVENRIPFDDTFDWFDHSAVYCTEFVHLAYFRAGIDLCPHAKQYVFPEDLLGSSLIQPVIATPASR